MKNVADFYNKTATGWSDEWLKEKKQSMILEKFQGATVEIHRFRGLCSFYAEMGGVLIGFEKG